MFPVQRGLYGHRSTMNQFAKPGYQFMNFDPFPFTNANLTDLSAGTKSPGMQQYPPGDEFFDHELINKEDGSINNMSTKKPLSKAERRAEHNAIERARRENLNTKFQSLAQALPNLINYRRPSKSQIVEKALDWVKQSLSREERYRYQILQLQRENKRLLAQFMSQQQQQPESVPVMRHSLSTPTPSSVTAASAPVSITTNTSSPIPNMYTTDFSINNGWSNNNNAHLMPPQMTSYPSTDDLTKQDFGSRSDDEDNASSGNEDDNDYQSSPCNPSVYIDSPHKQYKQQQHLMAPELYPIGFPTSEAHFDPTLMNNWSHSKYSPHTMNGSNIDPGLSSRSAPLHMLS